MKNNSLGFVKIIIFFFGLTVIGIASVAMLGLAKDYMGEYIFAVLCTVLVYSVIFCPMAFARRGGDFAGKVVGGTVYYKGAITYTVITIAAAVLAFTVLPLGASIGIECGALFIFLIYLFLAIYSANHVQEVKDDEKAALSGVTELRKLAQTLSSETASLGGDCAEIKKEIEKINENMRFLSPIDSKEAAELEKRMSALLSMIHYDAFISSRGNAPRQNVETYLRDFDVLYKQRKSILK